MSGYDVNYVANLPNNKEETGHSYLPLRHDLVIFIERLLTDCKKAKATSIVLTIVLPAE